MPRGMLFYVIGPSGSGKDSLLHYARQRCAGQDVAFAHRYITREANAGGENHVALSPEEFQARLDRDLFALHWESHRKCYGIGREIDGWMEAGLNVVANGSRAYLPQATLRYPAIRPVLITVNPETLRQRLLERDRETPEEIERRLKRAGAYRVEHPALVTLDNNGDLAEAGERLLKLLLGQASPS